MTHDGTRSETRFRRPLSRWLLVFQGRKHSSTRSSLSVISLFTVHLYSRYLFILCYITLSLTTSTTPRRYKFLNSILVEINQFRFISNLLPLHVYIVMFVLLFHISGTRSVYDSSNYLRIYLSDILSTDYGCCSFYSVSFSSLISEVYLHSSTPFVGGFLGITIVLHKKIIHRRKLSDLPKTHIITYSGFNRIRRTFSSNSVFWFR